MPTLTIESDEPVVILRLSEYESLMEILEILSESPGVLEEIEEARRELAQGKGIPFQDILHRKEQ